MGTANIVNGSSPVPGGVTPFPIVGSSLVMAHSIFALGFVLVGLVSLGIVARTLMECWHAALRALDDRFGESATILTWEPKVRIVPPASAIRRGAQPRRVAA